MPGDAPSVSNEGSSPTTSVSARPTRQGNTEPSPLSSSCGTFSSVKVASPSAASSASGYAARHSLRDTPTGDGSPARSPAGAVGAGGGYTSSSRSMTASRRASVTERHVTDRSYGHKRTASGDVGASWSAEALGLAGPSSPAASTAVHSRYTQALSYSHRRNAAAVVIEHSSGQAVHTSSSPKPSSKLSRTPSNKSLHPDATNICGLGVQQQEQQQDEGETPVQLAADSSCLSMPGSADAEAPAAAAAVAAQVAAEVVAAVRSGSLSAHASFKQAAALSADESVTGLDETSARPSPLPLLFEADPCPQTAAAASPGVALPEVSTSPTKEHSSRLWGFGSPKKEKSSGKVFSSESSPTKDKSSGRIWGSDHPARKERSSNVSNSGATLLNKESSKNKMWSSDAAARAVASIFGSDGFTALKKSLSGSGRTAAIAAAAVAEDSTQPQSAAHGTVVYSHDGAVDTNKQKLAPNQVDSDSSSRAAEPHVQQQEHTQHQAPEQVLLGDSSASASASAAGEVVPVMAAAAPPTPQRTLAAADEEGEEDTQEKASPLYTTVQPAPVPVPNSAAGATEAADSVSPQDTSEAPAASSPLTGISSDYRYSELLFRLQQFLPALRGLGAGGAEDFESTWELLKSEMTGLVSTARVASLQAGRLEVLDAEVMQLQRLLVEVGSSIKSGAQQQQLQHLVQSFPSFARRQINCVNASSEVNCNSFVMKGPLMGPAIRPSSKFPAARPTAPGESSSQSRQASAAAAVKDHSSEPELTAIMRSPNKQGNRYAGASELVNPAASSSRSRSPSWPAATGGMGPVSRTVSLSPVRAVVLPPVPKELTPDEAAQLAGLYKAIRGDPERIACRTLKVAPRPRSMSPTHPDRVSSPRRSSSPQLASSRRSATATAGARSSGIWHSLGSSLYGQHSTLQIAAGSQDMCSSWEYAHVVSSGGPAGVSGVAKGFRVVKSVPEAHRKAGGSAAGGVRRDEAVRARLTGTDGQQVSGHMSPRRRTSSPDRLSICTQQAQRDTSAGPNSTTTNSTSAIAEVFSEADPVANPALQQQPSADSPASDAAVECEQIKEFAAATTTSPSNGDLGYEYVHARAASPNVGMHYLERSPVFKSSPAAASRRRGVGSANPFSCSVNSITSIKPGSLAVERQQAIMSTNSDVLGSLKGVHDAASTGGAGVPVLADNPAFRSACQAFRELLECSPLRSSLTSSSIDSLTGSAKLAAKLASSPVRDADSAQVDSAMDRLALQLQQHGVPLDVTRLGPLTYSMAGRKLRLRMVNGNLLVRTGGGCVDLLMALGKLPTSMTISSTVTSPLNSHFVVEAEHTDSNSSTAAARDAAASTMTVLMDGTAYGLGGVMSSSPTSSEAKAALLSHHLGRLTVEHIPDDAEVSQSVSDVTDRKCEGGELGCDAIPLVMSVGGDAWMDIVAEAEAVAPAGF